jgi:predicted lipoprotein
MDLPIEEAVRADGGMVDVAIAGNAEAFCVDADGDGADATVVIAFGSASWCVQHRGAAGVWRRSTSLVIR